MESIKCFRLINNIFYNIFYNKNIKLYPKNKKINIVDLWDIRKFV